MTGFGRDAFSDAEYQAALGWETELVTSDGLTWLLRPGSSWLRWAGPSGWQPSQPPSDPNLRVGARKIEPPPGTQQNYRSPMPGYPLTSAPLPPQAQSAPLAPPQSAPLPQQQGVPLSAPSQGAPLTGQSYPPSASLPAQYPSYPQAYPPVFPSAQACQAAPAYPLPDPVQQFPQHVPQQVQQVPAPPPAQPPGRRH